MLALVNLCEGRWYCPFPSGVAPIESEGGSLLGLPTYSQFQGNYATNDHSEQRTCQGHNRRRDARPHNTSADAKRSFGGTQKKIKEKSDPNHATNKDTFYLAGAPRCPKIWRQLHLIILSQAASVGGLFRL